ncbi:MAG TPA: hypothetical protein PKE39_01785 [Ignavibacteria bacterium]|nr:hypothetical protein [Ignavibacteria bacterium]HMQ97730.1 hypothetical protein [Ignavibacteria bacterium]
MRIRTIYILLLIFSCTVILRSQDVTSKVSSKDTAYNSIATTKILNMLKNGKAPKVTLQLSFNYNIGHLDLAANENTYFRKDDFISGANFGTRYGYGASLTGKISLHKAGNVRLNVTAGYNRFLSNFVISESPEGKVGYNVFSGGLGIENNFTPQKKFKPYIGFELVASLISGNAIFATDTTDFELKIKNSLRFGATINLGFEYAFNNKVGMNLGYKLTHANILGKKSQVSSVLNETYLNDDKISAGESIQYAGWKQFLYSSFYAGVNFYFGMKNKK